MTEHETGERIAQARRAAGLSQGELAALVGVSRSAVAQWETGRAGQLGRHLAALAAALGVGAAFLLGEPAAPGAGRGDAVATDAGELALLRLYRELDGGDRALLLRTARRLRRPG